MAQIVRFLRFERLDFSVSFVFSIRQGAANPTPSAPNQPILAESCLSCVSCENAAKRTLAVPTPPLTLPQWQCHSINQLVRALLLIE
jgi:hypothetical protein